MKKYLCSLFFIMITTSQGFSQQSLNSNELSNAFDILMEKGSDYKDFEVIKKDEIIALQKQVTDNVQLLEDQLYNATNKLDNEIQKRTKLEYKLKSLETELEKTKLSKNQISFLGIHFNKNVYQFIVWLIIFLLLLGIGRLILQFKINNELTQKAVRELAENKEEFEAYKQKALEKQQKLGRQLQDEINKQRTSTN